MKKLVLLVMLATSFGVANATDKTASASWKATVVKDTTSTLVVTPLEEINMKYSESLKGFPVAQAKFDVAVKGMGSATNFKLTAQLGNNTLSSLTAGNTSKVHLGARWKGNDISKTAQTVLVDTTDQSNNMYFGNITSDLTADAAQIETMDFYFIDGLLGDGSAATAEALPDGMWTGNIDMSFKATWN